MRQRLRSLEFWFSCAFGAWLAGVDSEAQQVDLRPPSWAMEQQTRERWLHGSQRPEFSSYQSRQTWLLVDSIRGEPTDRRFYLTLGRTAFGRDSAMIVSDELGRIRRVDAGLAPFKRSSGMVRSDDSVRMEETRRVGLDGRLLLAEARVWDFVVMFPLSPHVGARWVDTISRVASDGAYRQTLSGRTVSRIVGDTTIGGLRLWKVQDSGYVTYTELRPERERTLDTLAQVSRTATGVVRGVHFYDPSTRLLRFRVDTAMLSGEAVLRYPDGRAFRTPARYERFREWQLHDSTQYTARRAALRTEALNQMGGMVHVPESALERRLARGDQTLRDSLMVALQRTIDGDAMLRLFGLLSQWSGRDASFRHRLDSVRIARGDTAHLYRTLADRAYSRTPTSVGEVRAMLPFMENPGKAWSLNASRDVLYENLVQAMTLWPRAAATGRDTGSAACTLEACRLLGDMRLSAQEPRLKDVALVALFSMDPATWADTILLLGAASHPLLRGPGLLAGGIGATWPAASKAPIPPAGSDWHVWLWWMDGRDTAYIRRQIASSLPSRMRFDTLPHVRFEESHRTAIRMYMARTGRDFVRELRSGYDHAANDTAQLVFGTILQGLGALTLGEAQIADAFASGQPGRAGLARSALLERFEDSAVAMPESEAAPLVDRLLAVVIDSAPVWPIGAADLTARAARGPELHAPRGSVSIDSTNLPKTVLEKWAGRVNVAKSAQSDAGTLRQAGATYRVGPVLRFGRFARLTIEMTEQLQRAEYQAPRLYASGVTFYLMNRGGEWVIVAWDGWVT